MRHAKSNKNVNSESIISKKKIFLIIIIKIFPFKPKQYVL